MEDVPLDDKLLFDAAQGNTDALANWIEQNATLNGIPYQLVAELIRSSRGCMNTVNITKTLRIKCSKSIDENGNIEIYTSKRESVLVYRFMGKKKPRGRPESLEVSQRNRNIWRDYRAHLKEIDAEFAYQKLAEKYHLAIDSIIDIIKSENQYEDLEVILRRLGSSSNQNTNND